MSKRQTPEQLAVIRSREQATTDGPWFVKTNEVGERRFVRVLSTHHVIVEPSASPHFTVSQKEGQRSFIAHAREDISDLLFHIFAIEADRNESLEAVEKESSYYSEMAAGYQVDLKIAAEHIEDILEPLAEFRDPDESPWAAIRRLGGERSGALKEVATVKASYERDLSAALTRVRELEGTVENLKEAHLRRGEAMSYLKDETFETVVKLDTATEQRNDLARVLKLLQAGMRGPYLPQYQKILDAFETADSYLSTETEQSLPTNPYLHRCDKCGIEDIYPTAPGPGHQVTVDFQGTQSTVSCDGTMQPVNTITSIASDE